MTVLECRRDRLVHVLDLARMYRGWTRQEVAAALGREPSKMIPESGNPKLDLVVGIAKLLEWSVGEVAECLWGDAGDATPPVPTKPLLLLRLAEQRRSEGRDHAAIECLQQALLDASLPRALRVEIQAELAFSHYTLWHLAEARALASELLRRRTPEESEPGSTASGAVALALAVRGHAQRRLIRTQPELAHHHAAGGRADLVAAIEQIDRIVASEARHSVATAEGAASPPGPAGTGTAAGAPRGDGPASASIERLIAVAQTARGGIVECDVELGTVAPDVGIGHLVRGLEHAIDPATMAPGPMLESWGWWSVFGANLALAHLQGDAQQRHLAIFTNKALEIAERTGSWSLRERAFMLEHLRRGDQAGPMLLDHDEVRAIIGSMGRFPGFRTAGWGLLRNASIVD